VSSDSGFASGVGVDRLAFDFLLCFPFLGMIEFAQDLTLRGLRLALRVVDLNFSTSSVDSSPAQGGEGRAASDERDRDGSDRLVGSVGTELSLRFDWKKPRFLVGRRGELGPVVGDVGDKADMGRLRSDGSPPSGLLMKLSSTAPAVLGRPSSSTVLSEGRPILEGCGLELLPPTMDDKLLVAE
jgi:hypothetical protein